jgi:hypothetical protein
MNRLNFLYCFQLNNYQIFNDQICPEPEVQLNSLVL